MNDKKYFKVGLLTCLFFILVGCTNLKPGDVIDNVEDYCYSEKEVWKEFKKRGFKEENITVLNFFGTQKPETIYTNYDTSFNFDWDTQVETDSDEKHPEYNFLYIVGDLENYSIENEDADFQVCSISIYGKSWYASCMSEDTESTNDISLIVEKTPNLILGEDDGKIALIVADFAEFENDASLKRVNKITHKKLKALSKGE